LTTILYKPLLNQTKTKKMQLINSDSCTELANLYSKTKKEL